MPMTAFSKKNRPGCLRLAPMPPTTEARWITTVGLASRNRRATSARSRRSQSALRGTTMVGQPRFPIASTTKEPRNPAPPVTMTRCSSQKLMRLRSLALDSRDLSRQPIVERLDVGVHHDLDEIPEFHFGFPPELFLRLAWVAHEDVHLGGAQVAGVQLDVSPPVQAHESERLLAEFLHRMRLSRGD